MNISQLRDEFDWQENSCRYLSWEEGQKARRLKNAAGLLLTAASMGAAYWFGIWG